MQSDVVIIGAGHSAGTVAINLRKNNYSGSIVILGEESYYPYQRPELSKGFLSDVTSKDKLLLRSENYYKKNNINFMLNTKVVDIDKNNKHVILENKDLIKYKKLVLATGSSLNKVSRFSNQENVFYLRNLDDSLSIKKAFKSSKKVVILGAGYIGLEIASIASLNDIDVTIIEKEDRIMSRVVSTYISTFLQKKHTVNNIKFLLQTSIVSFENKDNKKLLLLSNKEKIEADLLIIGIGVHPNITLAKKIGLECSDGIDVDEFGETSNKDIYACGDCANHYNIFYNKRIRLESVQNAIEQAITIAHSINGQKYPYNEVPWFWSNQYNIKLQIAGLSHNYDQTIIRGSLEEEKFSVFYMKNKTIVAVNSINDNRSFSAGKKLISKKIQIDKEILEDISINLKHYL